jgi:hypothetical protein
MIAEFPYQSDSARVLNLKVSSSGSLKTYFLGNESNR